MPPRRPAVHPKPSTSAAAQPSPEGVPLKICVLVKQVPDAAVEKRLNESNGRLDRSGETVEKTQTKQTFEGNCIDVFFVPCSPLNAPPAPGS